MPPKPKGYTLSLCFPTADNLEAFAASLTEAQEALMCTETATPPGTPPPNPGTTPPNLAPVAFLLVATGRTAGDVWTFNTTGTADVDGTVVTSVVNYGDGTAAVTYNGLPPLELSHQFVAGTYTVTLTVTDNQGLNFVATATIIVEVVPGPISDPPHPEPDPVVVAPTPALSLQSGQFATQPTTFSTLGTAVGSGVFTDYTFTRGDGSTTGVVAGAPPATLTHTYAAAGTYQATLTVRNAAGLSGTVSLTVIQQALPATPQPPTAGLSRLAGVFAGDTYSFALTGVDPDGFPVSWVLNPGNGGAPRTGTTLPATATAVYSTAGSFTARLTVTDATGLTTVATLAVTVASVPAPPAPGGNSYFTSLVARPETVFNYPLRSEAGIAPYRRFISGPSGTLEYDPSMDAMRCTLFANRESAPQTYLPIGLPAAGQLVIIYDWKPSANWIKENGLGVHKMWNVLRTGSKIWLEPQAAYYSVAQGIVTPSGGTRLSRFRAYPSGVTPLIEPPHSVTGTTGFTVSDGFGTIQYDGDSIRPLLSNYVSPRTTWARGMLVLDQTALNNYVQCSSWYCDETRDPIQVLDQCGVGMINAERPAIFDLEVNTSSSRTGPEIYCWFRNVVIMRGVTNPQTLLARPT